MLTSNACDPAAAVLSLAAASVAATVLTCTACGSDKPPAASSRSMVTPTTQIAGAGVLGNDRKPDDSCARDAAAPDPGPADAAGPQRRGRHPGPGRRYRLSRSASWCSPATSSTRCVRSACNRGWSPPHLPDGSSSQPSYLGNAVHGAPGVGIAQRARPEGHRGGTPGPDPGLGGVDADAVPAADGDRPDRVHRAHRAQRGRTTCAVSAPRRRAAARWTP